MYSFPNLEPVCCSTSSSNCCFLTCIQVSQEASQVVWYSNLLQSFPQFIVIHTVKGFGIVNKAEMDSLILLLVTSWVAACQAPLSMGFFKQGYWRGLPFPSPRDLPDPRIKPESPAWQADSLPLSHLGCLYYCNSKLCKGLQLLLRPLALYLRISMFKIF